MMKRIIGLVLLCFLIVGCNFGTKKETVKEEILKGEGELVVYNQSSVWIDNVIYGGEKFHIKRDLWDNKDSSTVYQGEKASKKFIDEETGYIFFEIYHFVPIKLRTNEIITVSKGERKVVAITDNTLVVVSGETEPVTVLEVIKR